MTASGQATGRHRTGAEWRRTAIGTTLARVIASAFLLLGISQFFLVRGLTQGRFRAMEHDYLISRTLQAFLWLAEECRYVESATTASAARTAVHRCLVDDRVDRLDPLFDDRWARTHDIDFVAVYALDGRRLWSRISLPDNDPKDPGLMLVRHFAENLPSLFPDGHDPKPADSFLGLAGLAEDFWIYSVHPVTNEEMTAGPLGVLITARLVDADNIASWDTGQGDQVSFVPYDPAQEAEGSGEYLQEARTSYFSVGRTTVRQDRRALISHTPLSGKGSAPIATLEVAVPNRFQQLGRSFMWLMSSSLLVMAVLTLAISILAVRRIVIRPLARLTAFFEAQTEEQEKILRIAAARDDEIGFLVTRADELMVKVREQRAELERLASTDRLTGLANRRSLEVHIDQELRRILRQGRLHAQRSHLAILLADVDHFKAFNDTYGHLAGDGCLRQVAEAIQSCAKRPGDLACRFGGEEFILVLPDAVASGALVVAEQVRRAVEGLGLPHSASSAGPVVTVSLGVAVAEVGEGFDLEAIIGQADQALYAAKRAGRNRVQGPASLEDPGH
jgi:diguanylate cyclase (GGDEF)-like protein